MKREGEGGERQMNYEQWEQSVPQTLTGDVLWKVQVYRLALYAAAAGWQDVTKLVQDRRTAALSDQLYRSLGSISANIAEGYSRSSSRDRPVFMNTRLVLPGRLGIGTTRLDTFWAKLLPPLALIC